jgi:hypothetical protein
MTLLASQSAKASPPSTKVPSAMESPKPPRPSDPGPRKVKLRVQWEKFSDVARELRYLSARQQAEVGENFEPYDPDWVSYFAFERAGDLAVWTARTVDSNILVGYIIWRTWRGLHCASTRFANADLVYLAPEWREGLTGYKLLKTGIAAVRPLVDIVRVETNDLYEQGRMGVLLKRLGLRRIGSVYEH